MERNITAESLIEKFSLKRHPEGGWFRQTYQSVEKIPLNGLPARFKEARPISTAIYYLLASGDFSAFHRIKSDEVWHFYAGGALLIHVLHTSGSLETVILGNDLLKGEHFQFVVPAGCWFAAEPAPGTSLSFVGCTVAPGFDFEDFEMANKEELINRYKPYAEVIERLCK